MAIVNSLPLTSKFNRVDSRRDGLMSYEDKVKLDNLKPTTNADIIIEPNEWDYDYDECKFYVNKTVEGLESSMYVIVLPKSDITKAEFDEIIDCDLDIENNRDGSVKIWSKTSPSITLHLNAIYSDNAVIIPVPEVYREDNRVVEVVLKAVDWVGNGPYSQIIPVDGLSKNMYGAIALCEDYSPQELRASILAKINTTQEDNRIIFEATGEKPTIDIRVQITYGNNVAMSFYPSADMDGFVEAEFVPFDNSNSIIPTNPHNVQEAIDTLYNYTTLTCNAKPSADMLESIKVGMCIFDTSLGKPIWCRNINPHVFVDSMGEIVYTY